MKSVEVNYLQERWPEAGWSDEIRQYPSDHSSRGHGRSLTQTPLILVVPDEVRVWRRRVTSRLLSSSGTPVDQALVQTHSQRHRLA
jgi:hypothetical protein